MTENKRKWAVVLGASTGTGAAISCALARNAHLDIFGVHRGNHPAGATRVEADINNVDQRCHMRIADAGTPDGASAGADELLRTAGPKSVKMFVHSIADASYGQFTAGQKDQLHPKQIAKTFDRMAHSLVYWVQEMLARDLFADGARIIGLTNQIMNSVINGWGLVAAAKVALKTYIKMLAFELGPKGYRVMLVQFGLVETQAIRMAFSDRDWENVKKAIARHTPVRRICTVEEVGNFVSLLSGDTADWFSGTTIDFAGGQIHSLPDAIFNSNQDKEM